MYVPLHKIHIVCGSICGAHFACYSHEMWTHKIDKYKLAQKESRLEEGGINVTFIFKFLKLKMLNNLKVLI